MPEKPVALSHDPILAQLVQELLGPVAWGHHVELLKKVKAPAARLWYLRATARFGCSRNVLLNQIKASAFERTVTEKKTHNFDLDLSVHFAEQADEVLKRVLNIRVVSIGLIDRSPVHPREVFANALADRAAAIIVAHNHPSGGVEPSRSDIQITAQIKAAGDILGIELLD